MAKAKPAEEYEDIPGTFVFNAERSRQGYGINMFCMSLMKDENRKAFKANEAEYLKQYPLTPRADRRDPQARLQPHARARRQHLFHRQARRDRRALVPPSRRGDDRLHPGRLCRDDAQAAAARSKATARSRASTTSRPRKPQRAGAKQSRNPNPQRSGSEPVAKIIAGRGLVARAGHRRRDRQQADRRAVLEARVLGLREIQAMDGRRPSPTWSSRSTTTTPRRSRSN